MSIIEIAAVLGPVAVIVGHLLARSDRRTRAEQATVKLAEIHVLVNSRLTTALEHIKVLEQKLGIETIDI